MVVVVEYEKLVYNMLLSYETDTDICSEFLVIVTITRLQHTQFFVKLFKHILYFWSKYFVTTFLVLMFIAFLIFIFWHDNPIDRAFSTGSKKVSLSAI